MEKLERSELKAMMRGKYDVQKTRIQTGLRLVSNFKVRLGQEPGEKETELDKKSQKILNSIRAQYKKITDGIARYPTPTNFKGSRLISSFTEFALVQLYLNLESTEKEIDARIKPWVDRHPLWKAFLKDTKGVGPTMAGVIISEFDIHKAKYASSLHAYSGHDVAKDGKGRSKRKEHLIDVEYIDKKGKKKTKKSITYNPFLKSKLMGVLSKSFIQSKSPYKDIYDNYKHRLEHHLVYKDVSKGHRDMMARRYMIKIFLIDLYVAWKAVEGLEIHPPYHEAKLGITHKG